MKRVLIGSMVLLPLAACQGGISVEGTLPKDTADRVGTSLDGSLRIEDQSGELVIETAKVLLGELEIEGRTEASEFEVGPRVLELGLAGDPTSIAFSDVAAGTYEEFGFEMARGGTVAGDVDEEFGDGESIIVDGTYGGQPFSYRSGFAAELEFDLDGMRVKDGAVATITVTFDVASWFVDADGSLLDPSDSGNRSQIEGNIEASVAAHVEDEDDDDEHDDDED